MSTKDLTLPPFESAAGCLLVQPPNPNWRPGDGLAPESSEMAKKWKEDEEKGWKSFDPKTFSSLYRLMISGIVPRPIGFVGSVAPSGVANLAPFSWFNMVSATPPLVIVSIVAYKGDSPDKDSTGNIRHTKEFTVNIISEPFVEAANFCSIDAPPDVSEWTASGLTPEKSETIKPAWVRESAFTMECELYQIIDIPSPAHPADSTQPAPIVQSLIIGQVKMVHARNAVLDDTQTLVDITKLQPLARLGGLQYGGLGRVYELPRPTWEEYGSEVRELEKKTTGAKM